jgi:galactonate dehydratase
LIALGVAMMTHRRGFLKQVAVAAAWWAQPMESSRGAWRQTNLGSSRHFEIVDVRRTAAKLEFRPTPRRHMDREIPHWRYTELCDVTLKSGETGTGETLLFYTWGVPRDDAIRRAIGKNAIDAMWDDSSGAGLQMALFDAVGRTAGVPVHALLGRQVHEATPLSWWNIDTSAEDMAAECQLAFEQGYRSYKTKGRPWFDVFRQMDLASAQVPPTFKIDMDFNDTLRDAERALPILRRLDGYPQSDIYESPIPQADVPGNVQIAEATSTSIAMHYGTPAPVEVVRSGCCDGFVVGGGASRVLACGRFCEQVDMPFWLQLVGSGLTAAYSLHFGAVLRQAQWPAVNCHQLYEDDLLTEPIRVTDGQARVPDRPGIGFEIDRARLQRWKTGRPARRPEPARLIETTWPDGRRMYTANDGSVNFMLNAANREAYPYFEPGADTRLLEDDGTPRWKDLYQRARQEGPITL